MTGFSSSVSRCCSSIHTLNSSAARCRRRLLHRRRSLPLTKPGLLASLFLGMLFWCGLLDIIWCNQGLGILAPKSSLVTSTSLCKQAKACFVDFHLLGYSFKVPNQHAVPSVALLHGRAASALQLQPVHMETVCKCRAGQKVLRGSLQ